MKKFNLKKISAESLIPLAFILISVSLLGFYAAYLNRLYYSAYGPFYDSLSYLNMLAMVMGTASRDGFFAAVQLGTNGSTVFFPWLEAALMGGFIQPTREVAVLIQLPLVLAQAVSGYLFFKHVPRYSTTVSCVFSLVLISFGSVFYFNGGLSDLRMDLSQTLAFGSAVALFSVARKSHEIRYWIFFGLMLGVSFLFRATTPVYAIILFGFCAFIDLFISRGFIKYWFFRYLVSVIVALVVSLWFFVINYKDLYYYYFVWNFDANADLPLSQSINHFFYVIGYHIGKPILFFIIFVCLIEFSLKFFSKQTIIARLNWPILLSGLIPVGFLVFFGAALNPFVSMVSVPGFLMFMLAPFNYEKFSKVLILRDAAYIIVAFIAIVVSASHGIENHKNQGSPWVSRMDGINKLVSEISNDIEIRKKKSSSFMVSYTGSLDSNVVINSFIYNQNFLLDSDQVAIGNEFSIRAILPLGFANPIEWNGIKGDTVDEKLHALLKESKNADYLILPEDGNTFVPHHALSPYALQFRDLIVATSHLKKIHGPIKISDMEDVTL